MKTLILGKRSNLSTHLARSLTDPVLMSARALLEGADLPLGGEPFRVVINSFQPATALNDVSDPVSYVQMSIGATARLLEALEGRQVDKVVYTSSASVYGDNVECRESDACRASGLHAGLKVANEALVQRVCARLGIDCTIARLFNMYGGDDRFSVISKIVDAAREDREITLVNGGNAIRDFIHVDDAARVFVALLEQDSIPVLNVASGVGVSIRSVVDALALRGRRVRTRSIERPEIRVSTANVELLRQLVDPGSFTQVQDHVVAAVLG